MLACCGTIENNKIKIMIAQQHFDVIIIGTGAGGGTLARLMKRWVSVLKSILVPRGFANDCGDLMLPVSLYFRKKLSIAAVAHQNGTCRFGENPQDSVLDINCRTHDLDNLYVVDSSFFPSSAAVNPTLTIIANALRVGDRLIDRFK